MALTLLGWGIGQGVTWETLRVLGRASVPLLGIVFNLIGFGALVAVALVRLGVMDGKTAFLASCPGALSQMAGPSP